jgi:hypothetical protein
MTAGRTWTNHVDAQLMPTDAEEQVGFGKGLIASERAAGQRNGRKFRHGRKERRDERRRAIREDRPSSTTD